MADGVSAITRWNLSSEAADAPSCSVHAAWLLNVLVEVAATTATDEMLTMVVP